MVSDHAPNDQAVAPDPVAATLIVHVTTVVLVLAVIFPHPSPNFTNLPTSVAVSYTHLTLPTNREV